MPACSPVSLSRLGAWLFAAAASLAVSLAAAATPAPAAPLPYTLENTEVVATPAPRLKRDYEIYVSLPADYATSTQRYPVVYVTDAPYAFPLMRAIAGRVDRHGVGLEAFILVGLSYAKGESGVVSRNRDYTPTERLSDRRPGDGVYGQSVAYLDFLAQDVLPLVDRRYRTDTARRVFVGHSYGGLLGVQAMLDKPGLFSHFILGSPSLWFDDEHPFKALRQRAPGQPPMSAKVRFYVGGLEQPSRAHPDNEDMVGQTKRYVAALRKQQPAGLDVKAMVLDGEDHATVFPRLITQGLVWALPRRK